MSIDALQEKIRKLKNPSLIDLTLPATALPNHLLAEEGSAAKAYSRFCRELMGGLKGLVPGVRFGFSAFALLGAEGMEAMTGILQTARDHGFYVALDAPEILTPGMAESVADTVFAGEAFPCDGLIVQSYLGSDILKPFLPFCKMNKKDLYAVVRTGNRSGAELQDLLSGSRLVHAAAADMVNRYGSDCTGKWTYSRVAVMAGANSAESLRNMRSKYPRLFLLVDGYDYPSANAKKCSAAFDKLGHGAVVCAGASVTAAWKQTESDGSDYVEHAVQAAERMKKNLTNYLTIL